VGELLTCPFCLAQWIATTSVAAYFASTAQTRIRRDVMSVAAASDVCRSRTTTSRTDRAGRRDLVTM
jgi:hypothetical protein